MEELDYKERAWPAGAKIAALTFLGEARQTVPPPPDKVTALKPPAADAPLVAPAAPAAPAAPLSKQEKFDAFYGLTPAAPAVVPAAPVAPVPAPAPVAPAAPAAAPALSDTDAEIARLQAELARLKGA